MFDNVVLHQADVNFRGHEQWVANIKARNKTYITTSYYDDILRYLSDLVNETRLGQMSRDVYTSSDPSNGVIHVDFTGAHHVNGQHWFFGGIDNQVIRIFCRYIANGESGETLLYKDLECDGRYQAKPFENFSFFPFGP